MKFFIVLALAAGCAADRTAKVVRSDSDVRPDGFSYAYETSNGISGSANAILNILNSELAALSITGENIFTGNDGQAYRVTYLADENGYQPQGSHLPTPPPVPEAIARALAYNAAHPQSEDKSQQGPSRSFPAPPTFPVPANKRPFPPKRF